MRSKVTRNQKLFSALLETLWFFSNMCSHVRGQVAWLGKTCSNKVFLQCVFACAWSGSRLGKNYYHTSGNNKVFLQYVFACAWSSVRMLIFRLLATENLFPHFWQQYVFFQYVFACASSGCWQRKIFFHTFGNNNVFLHMCSHVIGQIPGFGKSFSTLLARIRFFCSMCSHVPGQVVGTGKYFSTLMAALWFYFHMNFNVFSEIQVLRKKFSALMATKLFCSYCSFCVLDQCRFFD